MRIPLVQGRYFMPGETDDTSVIIGQRLAMDMYGTLDVIGYGFPKDLKGVPRIVGVVRDAPLLEVRAPDVAELYRPDPTKLGYVICLVRAKGDPAKLLEPLRRAAILTDQSSHPRSHLLSTDFEQKLQWPRVFAGVAFSCALIALALACTGLYATASYMVQTRRQELLLRIALGATPRRTVRMLLSEWAFVSLGAFSAGAFVATAVCRMLASRLPYLQTAEPVAYTGALAVLAAFATVAIVIPAISITREPELAWLQRAD